MATRRSILSIGAAAAVISALCSKAALAAMRKLVLVHGRSQQGRDPVEIKKEWLDTLAKGASALNKTLPADLEVELPFYGGKLDEFTRQLDLPLASDIHERGGPSTDEFLQFQAEVANEIRARAGVTDAQVNAEYGDNPREKGPLNWEWVQAIISAIDKHGGGISQWGLEQFTRDVFIYTTRAGVRDEIDAIVRASLSEAPTIVVGHSLGSVVAYNVLRADPRPLQVPLFVTVGSPLGIRAISKQLRPLRYPKPVAAWKNAFDSRDLIALYPLDTANFPVRPAIENFDGVDNSTDNRHGIAGYLNDKTAAGWVLEAIAG
jgi:hypothetical protein